MIKLPWTQETAPHVVLEINSQCNIKCKGCYKHLGGSTKPLKTIFDELEAAHRMRKFQLVTVAGGETTLHPELCQIVQHIRQKGFLVEILSNGLSLDDNLLEKLKQADLTTVMLHIDEGQKRPDMSLKPSMEEITALRNKIAERVARHGIDVGLSVTLFPEWEDRIVPLVDEIMKSKHIHYLFGTCYIDFSKLMKIYHARRNGQNADEEALAYKTERVNTAKIRVALKEQLNIDPVVYLPPPEDVDVSEFDDCPRWMVYSAQALVGKNGAPTNGRADYFCLSASKLNEWMMEVPRVLQGRYMFYVPQRKPLALMRLGLDALGSMRFSDGAKFLSRYISTDQTIKTKYFLFENGPVVSREGKVCCALFCPNATLRDGKFVPVCLGDHLSYEEMV